MTDEQDLVEFRIFLGKDSSRPAFDPINASDEDFAKFLDGEPVDVEARARELKAEKDAREAAEFLAFAKAEQISRGYDPETRTWVRPEAPADPANAPMPAAYSDDSGAPLVTPARFAQFSDYESEIGSLSDGQFQALLAARESGKAEVFGADAPDNADVDETYRKLGVADAWLGLQQTVVVW